MTLEPNDPRHGTTSSYRNHACRCPVCRDAQRLDLALYRARGGRLALEPNDPRHGKASTYVNYACRCPACREAKRVASALSRARGRTP